MSSIITKSVVAASGAVELVAADEGRKIRVHQWAMFPTGTAVNVHIHNDDNMLLGDATNKIALDKTGAAGSREVVLPFSREGWFTTDTINEALKITLSTAQDVAIVFAYSYV